MVWFNIPSENLGASTANKEKMPPTTATHAILTTKRADLELT